MTPLLKESKLIN